MKTLIRTVQNLPQSFANPLNAAALPLFFALAFLPSLFHLATLTVLTTNPLVVPGPVIAGFWLAALGPSIAALTCARVDETFRGRAYAIQQSAGTFGALVAPLIAARIVAGYGISAVFVFVSATFLVGSLVYRRLVDRCPSPPRPSP